jgi:hypothetical protein
MARPFAYRYAGRLRSTGRFEQGGCYELRQQSDAIRLHESDHSYAKSVGFFAYVAIPLREGHQALVAPTSYLPIGSFPHSVIFTGDNSAGNGGSGHFSRWKYGLINTALSRDNAVHLDERRSDSQLHNSLITNFYSQKTRR